MRYLNTYVFKLRQQPDIYRYYQLVNRISPPATPSLKTPRTPIKSPCKKRSRRKPLLRPVDLVDYVHLRHLDHLVDHLPINQ